MEHQNIITAAVVAILIFVIYLGLDAIFTRQQRLKRVEREARLTKSYEDVGYSAELTPAVELEQDATGLARGLEHFLRLLGINMDAELRNAHRETMLAGMTSVNAPVYITFYRRVFSWFVAAAGGFMLLKGGALGLSAGALLLVLGVFGAKLYVTNCMQKRQKLLLRSFPDGLDLMVVCVESGLALDAALNRVCDELTFAHPEMAKELSKTRLELALLNNRSQALMNLAERTDLVAYRSLAAALIQTERFGTSLTDTLRVLSDDYRQTRLMLAEEKAGRLPAMMAVPLITMLLPALVLIIMGPAYVKVKAQGGLLGDG